MGVLVDDDVKKRWLTRLQRRLELRAEISRVFNSHACATACAGDRRMIDRAKFASVRVGVEHDSFPVLLIAQNLVVQHDCDYGQLVTHHSLKLGPAMSEAPVAGDAEHGPVRLGELRSDGERQALTEARHSAWRQEALTDRTCGQVVADPDRRIARIRHHNRLRCE
jgi:hypothetical protein